MVLLVKPEVEAILVEFPEWSLNAWYNSLVRTISLPEKNQERKVTTIYKFLRRIRLKIYDVFFFIWMYFFFR